MSDVKFCDSCGTGLSANAMFCHNCGHKQVVAAENDKPATEENINREPVSDSPMVNAEPETEIIEVAGENDISTFEPQPEAKEEEAVEVENLGSAAIYEKNNELKQTEDIPQAEDQSEQAIVIEPVNTIPDNQQQEQKPVIPQPSITYQAQPQPQPQHVFHQAPVAQQAPYFQQAPAAQQAPYAQQAAPVPAPKKKKFPWFFTVLWLIMFAAVGIWGYFLLVDPNYNYPIFTPEAQRYVAFTVAAALLVYTLSLKLAMKKFKVIPTIFMIIFGVVIFAFFCLVELPAGNFLHDTVSNMFEDVIPVFWE